jgi:hypothetical protein
MRVRCSDFGFCSLFQLGYFDFYVSGQDGADVNKNS